MSRLNSVTYGTFKVGEGTSYALHGSKGDSESYTEYSVTFTVVYRAATETALKPLEDALVTAYRKPDQLLKITHNSQDVIDFKQDDNTGMNAQVEIHSLLKFRSNRSRGHRITITLQRPSDLAGKNFRQSKSVQVDTDESGVKTVVVTAVYTAGGDNSATDNVDAFFTSHVVGTVLLGVDADAKWETTDQVIVERDDNNKRATASTTYRELIFPQSASPDGGVAGVAVTAAAPDDTALDGIQYQVRVVQLDTEQLTGSGALPLTQIFVTFSSPVRKSVETDLATFVQATILPYLKTIATDVSGVAKTKISALHDLQYDPVNNRIAGMVVFAAAPSSKLFVSLRTTEFKLFGDTLVPVLSGDPWARDLWEGPGIWIRRIEFIAHELAPAKKGTLAPLEKAKALATKDGFHQIGIPVDANQAITRRVEGQEAVDEVLREITVEYRFARIQRTVVPAQGAQSGGRRGTSVPNADSTNRRQ